MFEDRFDAHWRLLLRALLSGVHGAHRAMEVYHKQHRAKANKPLQNFVEILCQDEVTCPESAAHPLTVKPMVCLFPTLFKHNFLAFLHHVQHLLPQNTVQHVLECIKEDALPNTWITSLVTQLERQLDIDNQATLFSAQCGQRLMDLSKRLQCAGKAGGWTSCFQASPPPESTGSTSFQVGPQIKRKSNAVDQDSDGEEASQQNKRMRVDLGDEGDVSIEQGTRREPSGAETEASSEALPSPPDVHDTLPESKKVAVLQLKDSLESHTEWEQSCSDVVRLLNDCDPAQVEAVCSTLNLPNLPERVLPKLCSSILELSPDLSLSSATALIKSLLLKKILSLSEPASRCLVTTVTSLCSRYPRAMCHAIFEHVLLVESIGNLQADLLNKLIEGCLDSHYKLLALQITLKTQWTEAVLSVIHCLLDSKLDISEDLFTQFTKQLMDQASQFTKSVKFAKMLFTVLTKYSSTVTAAHKHTLSNCLMLNETFLKKPLQAALKRINP